jgi:hypothetical protein
LTSFIHMLPYLVKIEKKTGLSCADQMVGPLGCPQPKRTRAKKQPKTCPRPNQNIPKKTPLVSEMDRAAGDALPPKPRPPFLPRALFSGRWASKWCPHLRSAEARQVYYVLFLVHVYWWV